MQILYFRLEVIFELAKVRAPCVDFYPFTFASSKISTQIYLTPFLVMNKVQAMPQLVKVN
jgi:hypothetical protein